MRKYNKETRTFEDGCSSFSTSGNIIKIAEGLVNAYESLEDRYKRVLEENKKLKEGIWEKEEIAKLRAEHAKMHADYYRGFPISESEAEKIRKFKEEHKQGFGVSGGGFTYIFTPTALGTAGKIRALNGDELEFQFIG